MATANCVCIYIYNSETDFFHHKMTKLGLNSDNWSHENVFTIKNWKSNSKNFLIATHWLRLYTIYIYITILNEKLDNGIGRTCLLDLIILDSLKEKKISSWFSFSLSHGQDLLKFFFLANLCIYAYIYIYIHYEK